MEFEGHYIDASEIGGISIIQSEALGLLNDATKKSLWNALKAAFA